MSESDEQITKNPLPEKKSATKDPKKVAAGKKLAEYNRKAKAALQREMEAETPNPDEVKETSPSQSESGSWIPELSFTTVVSLVGIGFTAFEMYMRYYKGNPNEPQIPVQVPTPEVVTQPSHLNVPRIGMI